MTSEPGGTGPAEDAPLVLRGKALRDAFILRLLAAERFIRGLLLVALAYGVYRFNGAQDSLEQVFREYLPTLKPFADKLGIDLQNTGPVKLIQKALTADHATLELVTIGVLAYGALELLEGVGLWPSGSSASAVAGRRSRPNGTRSRCSRSSRPPLRAAAGCAAVLSFIMFTR